MTQPVRVPNVSPGAVSGLDHQPLNAPDGAGSGGDYAELLAGDNAAVNTYLGEHPDEVEAVFAAERAGKGRKGILEGPHAS